MLYNIFVINKHLKYKPQWRYASITWVMFIAVLARANAQGVAS
nr:MAG TPA: Prokaryotic Cytochrome C oxidase subunit IV [Caudoviricetes sp.]